MADDVKRQVLWNDKKTKKLIRKKKNGRLVVCWVCPYCKPRVIASKITNGNLYQYLFDRNSDCFCLKISE